MIAFYISLFLLSTTVTTSILFGLSNLDYKNNTINSTGVNDIVRADQNIQEKLSITNSPPTENTSDYNSTQSGILNSAASALTPKIPTNTPINAKKILTNTPTFILKSTAALSPPTITPIPPAVKPTIALSPTPFPTIDKSTIPTTGLNADKLFNLVNDYRKESGKAFFIKDETTCSIADSRATQVYNEIYGTGLMHSGLKAMQLPYWITEIIISYSTEEQAFNWWKNDTIHRNQMLGDFKYSCTSCSGYSCSQVFTDYIPK